MAITNNSPQGGPKSIKPPSIVYTSVLKHAIMAMEINVMFTQISI